MANWINLAKLDEWDFPFLLGFQYDSISDESITSALLDFDNLAQVDPELDWEDDDWLATNTDIEDEHKHAYRVAALVHQFRSGQPMNSGINLDTFSVSRCLSCIPNGHHRIRAIQYLGVPAAPFELSGSLDPLEDLVRLAGVPGPGPEFEKYFANSLLQPNPDDVICELN